MNRRCFLSKSWFGALIPAVVVSDHLQPVKDGYYQYSYKGWMIRWTGWKSCYDYEFLAGQWLANKDQRYIYSSVPGAVGFYNPGAQFNITINGEGTGGPPYAVRAYPQRRRGGDSYWKGADFDLDCWQQAISQKTEEAVKDEQRNMGLKDLLRFIDKHGEDSVATL